MTSPRKIALVGDFRAEVLAHRCIPDALRLAGAEEADVSYTWVHTTELSNAPHELERFSAIWCVPGSPYANTVGALAAIRFARESGRPFFGTCGGFQHAVIEFSRNVLGVAAAEHAETCPEGASLVITRLSCSLVETTSELCFTPGSRLQRASGRDTAHEGYRCNYGVSSTYRPALEAAGLHFTAFDSMGEIRGFEDPAHPFFIGTLFQPERSATRNEAHPLIRAFVNAAGRTNL